MYVRCTHCGYDNSPEYRFCGMCGASLAHPPVQTTKPKETPPPENGENGHGNPENVHGPSFLGLAEDPKTEFHYLYEDEAPRSHAGLIFVVILLLGVGGAGYWQYSHNGFPFNRLSAAGNTPSASPSEVAPAQTQDQQTHADKPMTGAGETLPTAPDQKSQAPGTVVDLPPQGSQASPPATPSSSETNPASSSGTSAAAPDDKGGEEKTQEVKATPPEVPAKPAKAKAKAPKPAAPAATTSPDAELELAGERYLYGNGLPQNCTRAEFNLRTAATHGNTKAQTVLGTMYATGHCVGRDLPTAYRWFARALHQEPNNSRISDDLQVLWRQMTAQERQLATAAGQ